MRAICPNLRQVDIGHVERWKLQVVPGEGGGNITRFEEIFPAYEPEATIMEPPSFDFFDSYMIDHSFILFLTQLLSNDALTLDSWTAAIRSDSRLAHIDNWVDTGRVPVTLGDIGHLCERQVSNNI